MVADSKVKRQRSRGLTSVSAHGKGLCDLAWASKGNHLLTCGSEGTVRIVKKPLEEGVDEGAVISDHQGAVTTMAFSPKGNCFATGSEDHSVKLYNYPGAHFESNITRFTLPIRALAFSPSGSLLAAGGDDEGIRLITVADGSIARVLKGHDGAVLSLAFDPQNDFLASVGADGTIIVWELATGRPFYKLSHKAPQTDPALHCLRNRVAWHPMGNSFAAPGADGEVAVYDKVTGDELFSLAGGHDGEVATLDWSPNGRYMVTAGRDQQVMLWDVEKRTDLERIPHRADVCGLAWQPGGNAIAVVDADGKYGVWDGAVPEHMPSPCSGLKSASEVEREEMLKMFGDEEEEAEADSGAGEKRTDGAGRRRLARIGDEDADDDGEESGGAGEAHQRRGGSVFEDDEVGIDVGESDNELDSCGVGKGRKAKKHRDTVRKNVSGKGAGSRDDSGTWRPGGLVAEAAPSVMRSGAVVASITRPVLQTAFQPGSTPGNNGTPRHFLAYNMLGSISSREDEGFASIEVEFHDTSRGGGRIPTISDYYGFSMAALGDKGCAFASRRRGDKSPSTFMFKPTSSWAPNSDWMYRFPPEDEVRAVAVGRRWAACATSLNLLRIFSESGVQRFILGLEGPVLAMAGHDYTLLTVFHAADPTADGSQSLHFHLLDIAQQRRIVAGPLPLSPGASLSWVGFSDDGVPAAYDSKGVLWRYSHDFGGCWVPIFNSVTERKSTGESHWVVGLNPTHLFCVVCKGPQGQPQVLPRPVLSVLPLAIPLLGCEGGGSVALEEEYVRTGLQLSSARSQADEAAADGREVAEAEAEETILRLEAARDKCLLRQIAAACKGDRLARALELSSLLALHKSLEGAVRLVNSMRLPALAERMAAMLEARMEMEKAQAVDPHTPAPAVMARAPPPVLTPQAPAQAAPVPSLATAAAQTPPARVIPASAPSRAPPPAATAAPPPSTHAFSRQPSEANHPNEPNGVEGQPSGGERRGRGVGKAEGPANGNGRSTADEGAVARQPGIETGPARAVPGKPSNPFARRAAGTGAGSGTEAAATHLQGSIMDSVKKMQMTEPAGISKRKAMGDGAGSSVRVKVK